jgi:hypothetical protein
MLILTTENESFDLDLMPDVVDDLHFGVLDNSTPNDPDYIFPPLVFMESFSAPTVRLKIGKYFVNIPVDYQILIGEPQHGDLEVNAVSNLNDRDFKAFALNPLSSFRPEFLPVEIDDVLPSSRWFLPKLKTGQLLCVPLHPGKKPLCVYFVKEIPKSMEIIRASKAW